MWPQAKPLLLQQTSQNIDVYFSFGSKCRNWASRPLILPPVLSVHFHIELISQNSTPIWESRTNLKGLDVLQPENLWILNIYPQILNPDGLYSSNKSFLFFKLVIHFLQPGDSCVQLEDFETEQSFDNAISTKNGKTRTGKWLRTI